jgi:hypothetical protein
MFFKKKSPLKLEAYAPLGQLVDLFPIVHTKNALPSWYHNLLKFDDKQKNVRHCPGVGDLFRLGVMIPAWSDHEIVIYPDGRTNVRSPSSNNPVSSHNLNFDAPGAWPGYVNVKLLNPWMLYCNKPVKWLFLSPTWCNSDPAEFTIVPGVLEFRVAHEANVNMLFKLKSEPYTVLIKAGDSLMQMIPITEEKFELEVKTMTQDILTEKFLPWNHSFNYGYQKAISRIKKSVQ